MRSVRIVSDGTGRGTAVFDAQTGEHLRMIESIAFEVGVGAPAVARIVQLVRIDSLDVKAQFIGGMTGADPAPVPVAPPWRPLAPAASQALAEVDPLD